MVNTGFIKNILVPIDKSDSSLMSQEIAATVAKKTQASVTVLHVISRAARSEPQTAARILSGLEQEGQMLVAEAEALFAEEKVSVKTEVLREAETATTILEYAENADLVVMGGRGENQKDPFGLGSVTKRVMTHASCPIIIVKKASPLANILICLDGSRNSMKALEFTATMAKSLGSKITLLNVEEQSTHQVTPEEAKQQREKIFAEALDAVGMKKLEIDKKIETGSPPDVIVDVAEKGGYDLIVLASRGSGTVKKFLLGSVSESVSQKAKCSVLLVPAKT